MGRTYLAPRVPEATGIIVWGICARSRRIDTTKLKQVVSDELHGRFLCQILSLALAEWGHLFTVVCQNIKKKSNLYAKTYIKI